MDTSSKSGRRLVYLLVFLSGCAGLIYQVVWHKYLTILLGAQARATAVVLAIFLGGISAGYTCFGRWSRFRDWNLVQIYAYVEVGLACWAFGFPYFFRAAMPLTSHLYSALGLNSILIDIFVSALLIGAPTFLMGGTLPLLTQGLSEDLGEASHTHAKIYGYNTVGACIGSLLAGYVLIPVSNLPLSSIFGGTLNLIVAGTMYFVFSKEWARTWDLEKENPRKELHPALSRRGALLLGIGFLSGFTILTLETVFIRLMGLSTGSSNYNFTLIVSIFVFGLGIGSLIVRRIAQFSEAHLLWNQLGVALTLFALYLTGDCWPYWVHLIRILFRDIPQSFYVYQAVLGLAFLLLLIVPVGLCGLTMPFCFHLLKDRKETLGHRVGQLYGLNTVGCVMGALIGGYGLLAFFNLDQIFKICVGLSLVSVALASMLYSLHKPATVLQVSLGSSAFTIVLVGLFVAPLYAKDRFIQPFRAQTPTPSSYQGPEVFARSLAPSTSYLDYKDGRNTTVGVGVARKHDTEYSRTIFVNGKSDGNTTGDFFTMNLTGHIPAVLARKLDRTAVIGFGTGLTTGALARYQESKHIDVVDISADVIRDAHFFDKYNGDVSTNPKVHFNEMDAFRFLEGTREKFDVIVAEPSNPWVAGVENLYTQEMYDLVKRKLNPDGLFVQWVQAYSFNDELFRMVLNTISSRFAYVSVFQMLEHDFLLVATEAPITHEDLLRSKTRMETNFSAKRSLEESGITRFETLLALELIPYPLTPLLGSGTPIQRLETPRLSNGAAVAFFVGSTADVHAMRRELKQFYPAVEKSLLTTFLGKEPLRPEVVAEFRMSFCDNQFARGRVLCQESLLMEKYLNPLSSVDLIYEELLPRADFRGLASFYPTGPLKGFSDGDLVQVQKMFDIYKRFYSPVARFSPDPMLSRLDVCMKWVPPAKELYGDCLLERAAVLEIAAPTDPQFRATITQFYDWFAKLSPDSSSYTRFKEANEILSKVQKDLDQGQSVAPRS